MPLSLSRLGFLLIGCLTAALAPAGTAHAGERVVIPVTGGVAEIRPAGLAITFVTPGQRMIASAPSADLTRPGKVTRNGRSAQWSCPDRGLTASADVERGRLRITLSSSLDEN
ncbi:hypothetical protein [Kibdelosporangium phytohabitans]|uniref:Uncharacterized protein n=1 Tax=Kibdelosporangium phytohabitans TaxID=860235 RepID=A0A0N9IB97_9PSEU|nr:hypothetical protein [Kibdelosporangium phytohabitans]ALG11940.1 hypothetical protein AOZ06_38260 [Kibdelosporangium phytohabitans]MBE1463394.1 hypothetical protein [Kibdelosporangium phytohabitans]